MPKNRFKSRRENLGLRREDVAAASGVSLSTIYRIEESGKGSSLALSALTRALEKLEASK
jgi:transcriptional regulator with XRE-family HTH domain